MPTYFNPNQKNVISRGVSIPPRATITTETVIDLTTATITGKEKETFDILAWRNDQLILRFNDDPQWITITLTAGAGRTAAQIVADVETDATIVAKYGAAPGIASAVAGYVVITAPTVQPLPSTETPVTSRIFIRPKGVAAGTLGFFVSEQSPIKESFPSLIKIDDSPMYQPLIKATVQGVGTYTVTNLDRTAFLRLLVTAGVATFQINDTNAPVITLTSTNEPMHQTVAGRVQKIIVVSGTLIIEEWLNPVASGI